MDTTLTVVLGVVAMLLPLYIGKQFWKRFDHYFGKGDEVYMESLNYFIKKISLTVLVAFIVLWIGMSLVFTAGGS